MKNYLLSRERKNRVLTSLARFFVQSSTVLLFLHEIQAKLYQHVLDSPHYSELPDSYFEHLVIISWKSRSTIILQWGDKDHSYVWTSNFRLDLVSLEVGLVTRYILKYRIIQWLCV